MYQFVLIVHIIAAVCLIVLVLVQQGKGATVGATFGAGASQTIFGSRGAGSFLLKLTLGFVFVFFGTSIALNWLSSHAVRAQQVQGNELPAGLLAPEPETPAESSQPVADVIPPLAAPVEQNATPVALPPPAAIAPATLAPLQDKPVSSENAVVSSKQKETKGAVTLNKKKPLKKKKKHPIVKMQQNQDNGQ